MASYGDENSVRNSSRAGGGGNTVGNSTGSRARQAFMNSLSRTFDSPLKKATTGSRQALSSKHASSPPSSTSLSPRKGSSSGEGGSSNNHLGRKGLGIPMAPAGKNTRASVRAQADSSKDLPLLHETLRTSSTPPLLPPLSTFPRARSGKTATTGLRMHWERQEEEDSDLREGSAFSESMEIMQQSRHSLSLVTQDLAIPDLKDPDLPSSASESQFLLSPFVMSTPNFNHSSSSVPVGDRRTSHVSPAASTSRLSPMQLQSKKNSSTQEAGPSTSAATPTSPPRQGFFQTASTSSSFSRFPTPDKLALGLTPSPVPEVASGSSTGQLLLPPISPGAPISTVDNILLRSTSEHTIYSESSFSSSMSTSIHDSPAFPQQSETVEEVNARRAAHGHGTLPPRLSAKASRQEFRESLLSFPSPPTSPRAFGMGRPRGSLLSYSYDHPSSLASSKCSESTAPGLSNDTSSAGHDTEETRPSLEQLLMATATKQKAGKIGIEALPQPHIEQDPPELLRAFSLPASPEYVNFRAGDRPIMRPVPFPSTLPMPAFGGLVMREESPPSAGPKSEPAMNGAANSAHLNAFVGSANARVAQASTSSDKSGQEKIRNSNSSRPGTADGLPSRILRSPKSTESFIAQRVRQFSSASRVGKTTSANQSPATNALATEVKPPRRRRTSLSIKIPKILTRTKKSTDDDRLDSAALSSGLDVPQSRFSPDSDVPSPVHEKASSSLMKRLSRAVSSPNLRSNSNESGRRQSVRGHFITPISAPPVPARFPDQSTAQFSTLSPLPTPSLTTDIDSSRQSLSPRLDNGSEVKGGTLQWLEHNPYFPSIPASPALASPPNVYSVYRGPTSAGDMAWFNSRAEDSTLTFSDSSRADTSLPSTSKLASNEAGDAQSSRQTTTDKTMSSPTKAGGSRQCASKRYSASSSPSGTENGDEDGDGDDDKYGKGSASSDDYYSEMSEDSDEDDSPDDDMPLAQSHPDALQVQSTLRAKIKEQQGKKKRQSSKNIKAGRREFGRNVSATLNPATSTKRSDPMEPPESKSNVTGEPEMHWANVRSNPFGFAPDELSNKLKGLEAARGRLDKLKSESKRPESSGERPHDLLLPQTDEQIRQRSNSKERPELTPPLIPFVQDSVLTMSEGSDDEETAPLRILKNRRNPMPQLHVSPISRPGPRTSSVPDSPPISPRSPMLERHAQSFASLHAQSHTLPHRQHTHGQAYGRPAYRSKQRIYVNDPQHHSTFDIDENTTASSILAQLRGKGAISSNPAWCVTEVWRAMGVERPLREYEHLQDSIEAWSAEPNSTILLVKKSQLSPLLSRLSKHAETEGAKGWVQMEVKRGKWSKRWIELRDQSLYVGKSEKPRDQTLLCHFSNYDAYIVPPACLSKMKAPKPYAFAVKSIDKVSLFENADQDYIHFFSVKTEAERDTWMQCILDTRSTLVKQALATKAAAHSHDTRSNLILDGQQAHSVDKPGYATNHDSHPVSCSASTSYKSSNPAMSTQTAIAGTASLARRSSNAASGIDGAKIISASNLPPLPGAMPTATFATLPQGRDWERLGSEEKRSLIHEAGRKARNEGKALLDFGDTSEGGAGLLGRNRSKSVSQRR